MRIVSFKTSNGPNLFHRLPILTMKIDLKNWADLSSQKIPNFTDNLLAMLPGLYNHRCSPGHVGGFVERLRRGTYMAHIIEHIALELSGQVGQAITFGKTVYAGRHGLYTIAVRFDHEEAMKECLRIATDLAEACAESLEFDLPERMKSAIAKSKVGLLGPSGQAIIDAAKKKNIPWRRIGTNSLIELGYGKNMKRVQTAVTTQTSLISKELAQNKELTKSLLKENFLPVPEGQSVTDIKNLKDALKNFKPPYVIKPLDGNHGKGVSLNINNLNEAEAAFHLAKEFSSEVLVEEMCQGLDYRILVVDGKVAAAAQCNPPKVFGNGVKTISELINDINQDPLRGEGHSSILTTIEPDAVMKAYLAKQNLNLNSVLALGQNVKLRENANLSSGGTAIDVTRSVHKSVQTICERAARIIGLDVCGIDLICKDISNPAESIKIIEINAGPGLRMHLAPSQGEAQPVGEKIVEMLYPKNGNGRIPILSVTGTNGKTSVTRMLHKIFIQDKKVAGMTTSDGIWIGNEKVFSGDTTGPQSSQIVLSDPKVDVAVLEIARGGLMRSGLAYDWSDVSVVTNIAADHIGQDGIESLQDIAKIKSLVAERVREGGTLVLNADDKNVLAMAELPRVRKQNPHIFLYSVQSLNPLLVDHIDNGGSACWVDQNMIYLHLDGRHHKANHFSRRSKYLYQDHYYHSPYEAQKICLGSVSSIPSTVGGLAEVQVSNVLAAISAAIAANVEIETIMEGLRALVPAQENLGRLNLYKLRDAYVLLDYGHNEPAYAAMGKALSKLKGYKKVAIVGLPGDRSDELIQSASVTIANYFDHVIVKEEKDLRGRVPGVTASMMCDAISKQNTSWEIVEDESAALDWAISHAKPNTVIVHFYEKFTTALSTLLKYDPKAVYKFEALDLTSMETAERKNKNFWTANYA